MFIILHKTIFGGTIILCGVQLAEFMLTNQVQFISLSLLRKKTDESADVFLADLAFGCCFWDVPCWKGKCK